MEKRLLLALALSVLVMLLWQTLFFPPPPQEQSADSQTTTQSEPQQQKAVQQKATKQKGDEVAQTQKIETPQEPKLQITNQPQEEIKEEIVEYKGKLFVAKFSSLTASLKSFVLTAPKYHIKIGDKEEPIELISSKVVHNPAVLPFTIEFPVRKGFTAPRLGWKYEKTKNGIKFYKDTKEGVRIIKEFTFKEDYLLQLTITVQNFGESNISFAPSIVLSSWLSPESQESSFLRPANTKPQVKAMFLGELEKEDDNEELGKGWKRSGKLDWGGIDEHYFLQALIPQKREEFALFAKLDKEGLLKLNLTLPEFSVDSRHQTKFEFLAYVGPKEYDRLKRIGHGLENSIDFWVLGFLAKPMLWVLKKSYDLLGNWGLAILVLTILVRLILLPLTHKSQVAMQRMKDLKPKIDALKEKYGSDRDEFNRQVMELYRREKVNPLGGCLPILLQMPVYIALYRTLWGAVELYNSPFIPGWIDDLSKPEPLPIKVLPLTLGVLMFVQQKLTPQAVESEQQKVLMYAMPVMMVFFLWFLPSGLNLYILMSTLLGLLQQWVYNKLKIGQT